MKLKRKEKYPGIGAQLFRIRKTLDLTMRDISMKSKVPKDSIADFEQGYRLPNGRYLRYLTVHHNVNMNFIYYCGRKRGQAREREPYWSLLSGYLR
jgi:transcriptional regulator with XRE-family HTH domain